MIKIRDELTGRRYTIAEYKRIRKARRSKNMREEGTRIGNKLSGHNDAERDYVQRMTKETGEYIDQFTTVPDHRTTEEILSRVPKCCVGRPPAPTMEELMEEYKLKPAKKRDTSRARQKHGYNSKTD
jgi:hypothetical protein